VGHQENGEKRVTVKRIREVLLKPSVLSVFILVALWNLSVESKVMVDWSQKRGAFWETLAEIRNVNSHIQLRFYHLLTSRRSIKMQSGPIRFVYINDDVHWTNLYGDMPTSREFLAKLVRNASQPTTKALAIGIDVELLAPRGFPAGSDAEERATANAELKEALHYASSQGVPVVLATAYHVEDTGHEKRNVRLANIYTDEELPLQKENGRCPEFPAKAHGIGAYGGAPYARCVSFGYVNAPDDKREIALSEELFDPVSGKTQEYDSFALALAKAAEGWPPAINDYETFKKAKKDGKAIFGSFIDEDAFGEVETLALTNGEADAERACGGKILVIGGKWHEMQGYGSQIDSHLSPVGVISGAGFHANYVASLLQRQFATEIDTWVGVVFDLLVGLVIYMAFEIAEGWQKFLVLAGAALIPLITAYTFLVTNNMYLDFLLPAELYFLHIVYEVTEEYLGIKRKTRASVL
jgi:hypothetical protein